MIKLIVISLLCVTLALGQTLSECPPPACRAAGTADSCPTGSTCRDVKRPDSTTSDLRCICNDVSTTKCTTEGNVISMTCDPAPTTYCGGRNTPCPETTYCAKLSSGVEDCRCENIYGVYNETLKRCVIHCPENTEINNSNQCVCKTGYVNSCAISTSGDFCQCVPDSKITCSSVTCTAPYVCVQTNEGPRCVPSTTDKTYCGVNFRCPSDHFKCVDTDLGARCICAEKWGHFPACDRPKCYQLESSNATSEYGCWNTPNAVCVVDTSNDVSADRIGYCSCKDGYHGDDCSVSDTACSSVTCSVANTRCLEGRCVCIEGYVATVESSSNAIVKCEMKFPPVCDDTRCASNLVCVSRTNGPECVCPQNTFGSATCTKPRCNSDTDCKFLANSYCVLNTLTNVPGFCACKPGFTGERCEVQHSCSDAACPTGSVCDNEGTCRCDAGREGANCKTDRPDDLCVKVTLITRDKYTEEELRAKLAEFVHVDVVNFKVIEGPTERSNAEPGYRYLILVCRDQNVDEKKTQDDLVNKANGDEGHSAGFITAAPGDVADPDASGVAAVAVSTAVVCGAVLASL